MPRRAGLQALGGQQLLPWGVAFASLGFLTGALGADHHPPPWPRGEPPVAAMVTEPLRVQGGDRVLLACGQRYAPLHLQLEGPPTAPLYIGPEGRCAPGQDPVLDGRAALSWKGQGTPGQRSVAPAPARVTQVFKGDSPLPRARYPKDRYLILPAEVLPMADQLPAPVALELGGQRPLQGARLHARTQEWLIEEAQVVNTEGRVQPAMRYPLRPKVGVYFTGKPWMLDDAGAGWAFDAATQQLWLSGAPAGQVLASLHQPLLQVQGRGSLQLNGVQLHAAGADALRVHLDGEATVSRTTVRWAAGNGMNFIGLKRVRVQDSLVQQTGLDGIFFAEVRRAEVLDNHVADAGLHLAPGPALAAINVHRTDSAMVRGNWVQRAAYHGIRFAGDARIEGNVVLDSCLLLSDCAGIYTWRRHAEDVRAPSAVVGNVVAGVRGDTTVKLGVNDWFVGIYLDNYTNHVTVENNLVLGANQGIYLHDAWQVQVRNNVVRAAQRPLVNAADPTKLSAERVKQQSVAENDLQQGEWLLTWLPDRGGVQESGAIHIRPQGSTEALEAAECSEALVSKQLKKAGVRAKQIWLCSK